MSWDQRWMSLASFIAHWSKDRSTKVGAVIVDSRNILVSLGWNGFPRQIDDDVEARHKRPVKYLWTEHAERNAIYNAAAYGATTEGCALYTSFYPCADCCRAIIQAGIYDLVISKEPCWQDEQWGEHFKVTKEMLKEAKVHTRFL